MSRFLFPSKRAARRYACLLIAAAALSACGKSGGGKEPATQVAVKVNGDEISVHQVNQALGRAGPLSAEQSAAAGKKVLEQLIDQQLLIQKSLEKKLDRDPEVLSAIEASRRQILSQAYLERSVAAGVAKPGPEDIKKFYAAHPELFAQRRVYRFQELSIAGAPAQLAELREQVGKTKNLNEITVWLQAHQMRYNANMSVRAAEQLPQELLPRIAQMKDGDIGFNEAAGGATVVQLAASQTIPMGEQEATPFIERFLLNQKRTEMASGELKQLRESAKVEYMGDFVKSAAAKPADGKAAAAEAKPVSQPAADKAEPKSAGADIDKGVSGLR